MPGPVDVASLIYANVWQLLNASPGFASAFTVGRQIRFDQGSRGDNSVLRPQKIVVSTADLPQIQMEIEGGIFSPYLYKQFAQEKTDYAGPMIEEDTVRLKLTVTSQDQRYITSGSSTPGSDTLLAIIEDALRVSGPNLGMDYLLNWGPITWDRRLEKIGGMMVNQDILKLPIVARFAGTNGVLTIP